MSSTPPGSSPPPSAFAHQTWQADQTLFVPLGPPAQTQLPGSMRTVFEALAPDREGCMGTHLDVTEGFIGSEFDIDREEGVRVGGRNHKLQ